jgi:hypothetical protein
MPDASDPPRKLYQLKPKEFERVNVVPQSQETAAPRADAGPGNLGDVSNHRIDVRDLNRVAAGTAPLLGVNGPVNRDNEVHGMLRDNLAQADAAGLNTLAPKPKRRSRRKRDFWLLLIPVDLFLLFMAFGPHTTVITFVYGIGGLGLYTAALTWVMWFVIDDY